MALSAAECSARYRQKHPDRARASSAAYREAHPDRKRASEQRYRDEHPERVCASQQRWADAHPEERLASSKAYREAHLAETAALAAAYRARYPEKVVAHSAVGYAVRIGRLIRPDACEECHAVGPVEGHHYLGYVAEHRLMVRWLCNTCHHNAEKAEKEEVMS
jgi:hypothetical protein